MVDLSKMTKWDMGKLFDFSVLPKQSTEADIRRGCQIAKEYNCKLLDLNKLVNTSKIDGLHYEAEEHKKIAESVIKLI